jgi:hypothetical protein
MAKTLAALIGASAIALLGVAAIPCPAAAGSHVGVEVGPGGVHIGPRHRYYYDDEDDWSWRHRHYPRGAWYEDHHRHYHD